MPTSCRLRFAVACAGALGITMPSHTLAQAGNTLEIVIGGGPHAGTHKLSPSNTICLYVKDRKHFSAAYKDVNARDAKTVSGAGINVLNVGDGGVPQGQINIRFGDPDEKRPAAYEFFVPRDSAGSLALSRKGKLADVSFDGQTKNGVKLRMTAKCGDVDEL